MTFLPTLYRRLSNTLSFPEVKNRKQLAVFNHGRCIPRLGITDFVTAFMNCLLLTAKFLVSYTSRSTAGDKATNILITDWGRGEGVESKDSRRGSLEDSWEC